MKKELRIGLFFCYPHMFLIFGFCSGIIKLESLKVECLKSEILI